MQRSCGSRGNHEGRHAQCPVKSNSAPDGCPSPRRKFSTGAAGSSGNHDVTVTVAPDGRLTEIALQRWNGSAKPPRPEPFGGAMTSEHVSGTGVRVAGTGTVGWDWDNPDRTDGVFFRYTINTIQHN